MDQVIRTRATGASDHGAPIRNNSLGSMTALLALGWSVWIWMIAGPPLNRSSLPEAVEWYDLIWCAFAILTVPALVRRRAIPKLGGTTLIVLFAIYLSLVLILPVFGLLFIRQADPSWYLGDLRWIQVVSIGLVFSLVYRYGSWHTFRRHLAASLLIVAALNMMVLLAQIGVQGGRSVPIILEMWYPEGGTGYGRYGFHLNRFAGAMNHASGLALVGGVLLLFGFLNRSAGARRYITGFSGLVFVLASGNRSLIFGLSVVIPLVILISTARRGSVERVRLLPFAIGVVGSVGSAWLAWTYNLGRVLSGDRIQRGFAWLSGDASFSEVSGRGGDRWFHPVVEAQDWTPLGTLVNPSHALAHLPAFDSYYVVMIAQGGPLLASSFILLLAFLTRYSWKVWLRSYEGGSVSLAIVLSIALVSVTQNLMTGLSGRVLMTIAILNIVVYISSQSSSLNMKGDEQVST